MLIFYQTLLFLFITSNPKNSYHFQKHLMVCYKTPTFPKTVSPADIPTSSQTFLYEILTPKTSHQILKNSLLLSKINKHLAPLNFKNSSTTIFHDEN